MAQTVETYTFSADIVQLMGVIVNTVYANKDIFLRELISNASDALERARSEDAEQCLHTSLVPESYRIRVLPNRVARTLTIEDSGVGMTKEELIDNLGTIARSKTKSFLESVSVAGATEPALIGQFGIGFYSAYVVSERVRVSSKSYASDSWYVWESSAGGAFTLEREEAAPHCSLQRGTRVVCFLKEDQGEFLDSAVLRRLLMRQSCFINWPIDLCCELLREDCGVSVVTHIWEHVNRIRPIWLRDADDVSASEYAEAYKWLTGDIADPLATRHIERSGDRQVDFSALLFCSTTARGDIFDLIEGRTQGAKISLYVRRVFVKEYDDLLPKWMCFITGIVDSDDLPLNISREHLQKESAVMRHITRVLVHECLNMIHGLSSHDACFRTFHNSFSQNLKLGVYEDVANRPQIVPLLRYHTTTSGDKLVSLREYVSRMKPQQRHILYVTGRSWRHAFESPLIEGLKRDSYEVILMSDPADEFAIQVLNEFDGLQLTSATSAQAALPDDEGCAAVVSFDAGGPGWALLEALRLHIEVALSDKGQACKVVFEGRGPGPMPIVLSVQEVGLPLLVLDASHGLFQELARRPNFESVEQDLVLLLHDLATAFHAHRLQSGSCAIEVWRRLGERLQDMVRRLDGGDRDADEEDLPCIQEGGKDPIKVCCGSVRNAVPLSIGSLVRVAGDEHSRRGMITFVDEVAGTVDVLYCSTNPSKRTTVGTEDNELEAEGLPIASVSPLLEFEIDAGSDKATELASCIDKDFLPVALQLKEEGNTLFRLKDFEAADERYTLAIDAMRRRPLHAGQWVLRAACLDSGSKPCLRPMLIRRVSQPLGTSDWGSRRCLLSDGSRCTAATVLPVFGLSSLRPTLEQIRAFRRVTDPVLDKISALAELPAVQPVSLQATAYANRARCRFALGFHRMAAQDLTVVFGIWDCLDHARPHTDVETSEAILLGLCTAGYLRAKTRSVRGLGKAAAVDVREALARRPPLAVARQLEKLQTEVCTKVGERHRVQEPLARELAKLSFAVRDVARAYI